MSTHHDSAQTLLIEGSDAIAFAQVQFSSNLATLDTGHWQFSAWLDAQGRVLALFQLCRLADERLLLLLRGGDAEAMANALRRYIFRAKVKLSAATAVLSGAPALPLQEIGMDADTIILGCGTHSLRLDAHTARGTTLADALGWRRLQIHAGWPWLPDPWLGKLLPPALSLEHLQAVAFDKGCYPGQEIVARLHYRGGHKWHLHRVVLSRLLDAGSPLQMHDHEALQLLDVVPTEQGIDALAVIRDDAMTDTAAEFLDAVGQPVQVVSQQRWPA